MTDQGPGFGVGWRLHSVNRTEARVGWLGTDYAAFSHCEGKPRSTGSRYKPSIFAAWPPLSSPKVVRHALSHAPQLALSHAPQQTL